MLEDGPQKIDIHLGTNPTTITPVQLRCRETWTPRLKLAGWAPSAMERGRGLTPNTAASVGGKMNIGRVYTPEKISVFSILAIVRIRGMNQF